MLPLESAFIRIMETLTKQRLNILWVCTLLFALRVIAQPLSQIGYFSYLPHFEAWYSGALSYPVLLGSQVMILFIMLRLNVCWSRGIAKHVRFRISATLPTFDTAYLSILIKSCVLASNGRNIAVRRYCIVGSRFFMRT